MRMREIAPGIHWLGAVHWDRRLFDALIPLPEGTSYNCYLVQGEEKTVLLDTVDPTQWEVLAAQLAGVEKIDYVVAHHAEQDHSGSLPLVLERFPAAKVITTPKGKELLELMLHIPADRFVTVEDGETLDLGGKTLEFVHLPWVHWPETMVTYLREDKILFSCDFFGCHLATSDLYADDRARVYRAAKRYFAEIMMPFRQAIEKNLERLKVYDIHLIAPSHGPVHREPDFILQAYRDWVTGPAANTVVIPYTSMHGSTEKMVHYLTAELVARGVKVELFNLPVTDSGELAMTLVDAATVIIGTPTVLGGPHPNAVNAAVLTAALRPRLKFISVVGSYGWGGRAVETLTSLLAPLKAEVLPPVLVKGLPREEDYRALAELAETVVQRHKEAGIV